VLKLLWNLYSIYATYKCGLRSRSTTWRTTCAGWRPMV